jgi:hypothetical protein
MLRQRGVGNARAVRDLPRLKEELSETAADLVVISSDLDQKIFSCGPESAASHVRH